MRRWLLAIFLLLPLSNQAQTSSFTCEDGINYRAQATIIPPVIDETLSDIAVTLIASSPANEPLIGISTADDITYCNAGSSDAEYYSASLLTSDFASSPTSAQDFVLNFGENQVQIADFNDKDGHFLLIFESQISTANHLYQLNITPEMLAAGEINAYLFALTGAYTPSLLFSAPEQDSLLSQASGAELETLYDSSTNAVHLTLPAVEGIVDLTVEANGEGFYALALEITTGTVVLGNALAELTAAEDSSLSLFCDSELIYNNAVRLFLPEDNSYTVTALAGVNDPVLAVLQNENTGFCFDDTLEADTYSAELDQIEMPPSLSSAQAQINPTDNSLVVGGRESAAGDYLLLIEGGLLEANDEGDSFELEVSPAMVSAFEFLNAYVYAADETLDPLLTWEAESPITCDNAGMPENCPESLSILTGTRLILADSQILMGIDLNPRLEIPIDEGMEGSLIRLRVQGSNETSGAYVLVLHYITN